MRSKTWLYENIAPHKLIIAINPYVVALNARRAIIYTVLSHYLFIMGDSFCSVYVHTAGLSERDHRMNNCVLSYWKPCQGDPGNDGVEGEVGPPGFYGEDGEPGRQGETGAKNKQKK